MLTPRQSRLAQSFQQQRSETSPSVSKLAQSMQQSGAQPAAPPGEGGTIGNILETLASPLSAAFSQKGRANLGVGAAGALSGAILHPAQALLQIPGLFSNHELGSDKAADFVKRLSEGLLTSAEEQALRMGMTEKEVMDAYAVGNFIGAILPVVGSVKVASILLRSPLQVGNALTVSSLVNESVAGALFGGLLVPSEDIDQRTKNLLSNSAMFGVGRLMLAGVTMPFKGMRAARASRLAKDGDVERLIADMENGRPFEVKTENEARGLATLLSEEEMIASSAAAQEITKSVQDERALLHAVMGSVQGNAGIVRGLGRDFPHVASMIDKFKAEFPKLKFSAVRTPGDEGYSVYFGTKGLNNKQLAELKLHGRFAGQQIEKHGAIYEVVDPTPTAKGKITVRTSDGLQTKIEADGITDNPHIMEKLDDTLMMDDLFENFRSQVETNWSKLAQTTSGEISEVDLIRQIREGRMKLTDAHRRAFDIGGAITYPEELGIVGTGKIVHPSGQSIPFKSPAEANAIMESFAGTPLAQQYKIQYDTAQVGEVARAVSKRGFEAGRMLTEGGTPTTFEDMVEAWAKQADLPVDAPDFPVMKAHFGTRLREWMWSQVPKEELSVFRKIQEEHLALIESGVIDLETAAGAKGFTVRPLGKGRVEVQDLRTGMKIPMGSEQRARDFITRMVRSDSGSFGDPFNMGSGGLAPMQMGFNITDDGIMNMDGTIPTAEEFIQDLPATSGWQNIRDMFQRFEASVGVPLFTTVFDGLDQAMSRKNQALEPWARKIGSVWSGLSVKEAVQVGRAWSEVDGSELTLNQAVQYFKNKGLSPKQINSFLEGKKVFDALFKLTGIDNSRYINLYYSKIVPYAEKYGGQVDLAKIFGSNIPPEFQAFMHYSRTGDLAMQELNPALVMHKYARTVFWDREVAPLYEKARALLIDETAPRAKHLSQAQREAIETAARRKLGDDELLLAPALNNTLKDYLNVIRGMPTTSQKKVTTWGKAFFKGLGINIEERAIEELANVMLSTQYGAALAFRPVQVVRNLTQNTWTLYPRLGGKHYSGAVQRALTQAGLEEAEAAGAIRATEAGLPLGEDAFRALMDRVPIEGTGPMSKALAGSLRAALRAGNLSRGIARKGLIPYASTDDVSRSIAYHWQKAFTAEKLELYEAGKMTWEKFLDDGLPLFHNVTKQQFTRMYNRLGRSKALQWIGKQGADEANWIYGAGAQPAWLQNAVGRQFGMFGTWSMWATELYWRRAKNATPKQFAAFHARTLALVGIFANMTMQSGYNMWSYIAPSSMLWAGGPVFDNLIQIKQIADSPMDQKASALTGLAKQVGRLSLPGQVAYSEFRDGLNSSNPAHAAMRVMIGRPLEQEHNFSLDVLYDGKKNTGIQFTTPEGEAAMRSYQGLQYPRIPLTPDEP